jgi:2-alkenal reductase
MDPLQRQTGKLTWLVTIATVLVALVVGAGAESLLAPHAGPLAADVKNEADAVISSLNAGVKTVKLTPTTASAPSPTTTTQPAGVAMASNTATAAPIAADEPYISVVRTAGPAVVTVVNQLGTQVTPFGQTTQPQALGSGIIIDSAGHIVTNNHVVAGGEQFQVIFSDARKVPATLVGRDPLSDIAVLKVDGPVPAVATFGDSSALEPGEQVVAIGSALGNFRNTVTHGIVSGLDRTLDDPNGPGLTGLIQTDAPINHGNSGGPLLNLRGEVIGINTAVISGNPLTGDIAQGLGFAVPSNTARQISDELIKNGTVKRAFLGITYQQLSPQIASYYGLSATQGAFITGVQPGSPADAAGLKAQDVVTAIDGTTLDDDHPLSGILLSHKVGDAIQLTVNRAGTTVTLKATLGERPATNQ